MITKVTSTWRPGTRIRPLPGPGELLAALPLGELAGFIGKSRDAVRRILDGDDDRLLVVTGPCSVHDPAATLEYGHWLAQQARDFQADLMLVMRAYAETPRTAVGWTGLVNDPNLDGSCDMAAGLRITRALLLDLAALGVPTACEWVDPRSTSCLADTITWGAIGARTTESQTHRHLASGLPMPVGFKNSPDGDAQAAINAILCAAIGHTFHGAYPDGAPATITSPGNPDCCLVLRGGRNGPNYSAEHLDKALAQLAAAGLPPRLMIDASHGNSGKTHSQQAHVLHKVAEYLALGEAGITGVLMESFLVEGRQEPGPLPTLTYGQSITDACIDTTTTRAILESLADAVQARRSRTW